MQFETSKAQPLHKVLPNMVSTNLTPILNIVRITCPGTLLLNLLPHTSSLWVFCPPVSIRDDVYGPLGNQERTGGGVGLRETDEGFLEWSSLTHPPAQCCWCLEPGTTVCVRTAGCGDPHLLQGKEDSYWRTNWSLCLSPSLSFCLCFFSRMFLQLSLFLCR